MSPKTLRFGYVCEFLIALIAIFAAWSEIGGQPALDVMHWGWKFGLSVALAASIVAYTAALIAEESLWNLRAARWLTTIVIIIIGIGVVTYYYALQADTGESDETGTVSRLTGLTSDSLRA
ncbi:MAG TPA: hypothetical protein VH601_20370 [Bryobacteraceae bacterium]|jgi:hypothetical protein